MNFSGEEPLVSSAIDGMRESLTHVNREVDDTERIDQLRALEEVKAAAAAAQAQIAADFDVSQRRNQAAAGVPAERQGRGVSAQVALARRVSPHKGSRHLGLAKALVGEMPFTYAALSAGIISEWRATLLIRETACLTLADRQRIDQEICADVASLERLGDRQLVAAIKRLAAWLDPASVVARNRRATAERHVSCRPAANAMCYLTALVPMAQGVSAYAALCRTADNAVGTGDGRTRGQVMADTLVARISGQTTADAVNIGVNIVISDQSLLAGGDEPADLAGFGPIPASIAAKLVTEASKDGRATLRRLYADHGALTAIESRARLFPAGLRRFIEYRDQTCRSPWCDAPIRHHDHITASHEGGSTTIDNGQGLCAACNYAKQAPDWRASVAPPPTRFRSTITAGADAHTVDITTPTGHTYRSTAPRPPTPAPVRPTAATSRLEKRLSKLVLSA